MRIYPAIDIRGGRCVRLVQGNFDKEIHYSDEPWRVAVDFCSKGAKFLHIVDLDGARSGSGSNNEHIKRIIDETGAKVQLGGGIRNMKAVEEKFALGVVRVILGTGAIKNPEFVREAVKEYGERIAVGIDAKNGLVAIRGWEETTEISSLKLAYDMRELGVQTIVYTDISKDCMLTGPNTAATDEIAKRTGLDVIASGGVGSLEHLKEISQTAASGVIIGNALYTGALSLAEAIGIYGNE